MQLNYIYLSHKIIMLDNQRLRSVWNYNHDLTIAQVFCHFSSGSTSCSCAFEQN